jgi:hypothetical protein
MLQNVFFFGVCSYETALFGPLASPGLLTAQVQVFPSLYLYQFSLCDFLFYQDDGGSKFPPKNGTHLHISEDYNLETRCIARSQRIFPNTKSIFHRESLKFRK